MAFFPIQNILNPGKSVKIPVDNEYEEESLEEVKKGSSEPQTEVYLVMCLIVAVKIIRCRVHTVLIFVVQPGAGLFE